MSETAEYADLTIKISRPAKELYWVELSFVRPDGSTEQQPASGRAHFDFNALRAAADPLQYGRQLRAALFGEPTLREFFLQCLPAAGQANKDLRVRVLIDNSALELHGLRWETLRDPNDQDFLALNSTHPFSRFLYSADWRQLDLRPKGRLRALVAVANPKDFKLGRKILNRTLAEVDVAGEIERATSALQGISPPEVLESRENDPGRVTKLKLFDCLDRGGFDILYLVCHGAILPEDEQNLESPKRPFLFLEKEDGTYARVDGEDLALFIARQPPERRPRLVILASCQSGGQGKVPASEKDAGEEDEPERSYDRGALAALGPRLVDAGVPAVIAMQDNVKMETVRQFTPRFFQELLRHGQVDLAVSTARRALADAARPDWWSPVVFLRLRGGRLWYAPGFSGEAKASDLWSGILASIDDGKCVPVVGAELLEGLTGSFNDLAMSWASQNGYPLAPHARHEMPQVAQYLSTRQGTDLPRKNLEDHLKSKLRDKCRALGIDPAGKSLAALCEAAGAAMRQQDESDPYRILASLPISIYILTSPVNLLETALKEQNKDPQSLYYCWNTAMRSQGEVVTKMEQLKPPTSTQPLVYYLFGSPESRDSWVVSEDDYFEYLMWINRPDNTIPDIVRTAWQRNALMFLGFQMSDWNFRVLYRSILDQERRSVPRGFKSVAVQIRPGDDNLRPESACTYLTQFFPSDKFNLYWGSATNFLAELWEQWKKAKAEAE